MRARATSRRSPIATAAACARVEGRTALLELAGLREGRAELRPRIDAHRVVCPAAAPRPVAGGWRRPACRRARRPTPGPPSLVAPRTPIPPGIVERTELGPVAEGLLEVIPEDLLELRLAAALAVHGSAQATKRSWRFARARFRRLW